MDSLLRVWRDEGRGFEERLSALNEGYRAFHAVHPDTFFVEMERLQRMAEKADLPMIWAETLLRKGGLLNYQGQNQAALLAYAEAEAPLIQLGDSLRLGTLAANRGNVHAAMGDYILALEQFSYALRCYETVGHVPGQHTTRMALGSMFMLLNDEARALSYYEALEPELRQRPESEYQLGLLYTNLGWCHRELGELELAERFLEQGLASHRKFQSGFHEAKCLSNLARVHLDAGELSQAETRALESIALYESLGAERSGFETEVLLVEVQLRAGRAQSALDLGKPLLPKLTELSPLQTLYKALYEAHKALGQNAVALYMLEQHHAYRDSVLALKNNHRVARVAYEKDVEHQLHVVRMEGRRKQDRLRIQQLRLVLSLVIGFGGAISLLIAHLVRFREDQRFRRQALLHEIESLKSALKQADLANPEAGGLDRERIEQRLGRTLNPTDWKVLNILLDDPAVTNLVIAERAFMSVDGIGSSLRRMYQYFEVTETKYKKIALLRAAMTLSTSDSR
jgi:tetratricopeptide (TPR) repeat protein